MHVYVPSIPNHVSFSSHSYGHAKYFGPHISPQGPKNPRISPRRQGRAKTARLSFRAYGLHACMQQNPVMDQWQAHLRGWNSPVRVI